jgi:hypothetical protein
VALAQVEQHHCGARGQPTDEPSPDGVVASDQEPYVIVIPPPNVTAVLHMGHGLNNTVQDVLVRWNRMKGRPTVWVPGTDHAGIATQNVVERKLAREEGKSRFDVGREVFEGRVWEFVEETGGLLGCQHRARGVEILTGAEVVAVAHDGVTLADGSVVQADAVLIGVGAMACDSLARSAGLRCDDGVVVDDQARTSDPSVFAVGDMTRRPIPVHGGVHHRLESVPNALEQAKQAAAATNLVPSTTDPPPTARRKSMRSRFTSATASIS